MKKFKKKLAILLIACMMVSILPSAALAQEHSKLADMVVYNLLDEEIIVGNDAAQAEETPWAYKLFEKDGSYTIELEENAFFPYEVQFICDGVVDTVWFATPESTVEIGGHIFAVHTEQNDATQLSQLGFYIGDDYVPAYPEPKEFSTTSSGIAFFSLLPLEEVNLTVKLDGYTPAELNMIKVSSLFSSSDIPEDAVLLYSRYGDNFQRISKDDYLDLSWGSDIIDRPLQFIVGTAEQLNVANKRYVVRFTDISQSSDWLIPEIFLQDEKGERTAVELYRTSYDMDSVYCDGESDNGQGMLFVSAKPVFDYDDEVYLGLSINEKYSASEMDVSIYKGVYDTAEEAIKAAQADASLDITEQLWNPDMAQTNAGYKACFSGHSGIQLVTLVIKDGGIVKGIESFFIDIYPTMDNVFYSMYALDKTYVVYDWEYNDFTGDIDNRTVILEKGYSADNEYYASFRYYHDGKLDNTPEYIEKAVLGHYDTLEAAAAQSDIKEQMFIETPYYAGYQANYSGNGVDFTVFTKKGEVYKFTIKVIEQEAESEPEPEPDLGELLSGDPYFQATGVNDLYSSQIYHVRSSDDDYYTNGYQTLLVVKPDVDLSQLQLTFAKAEKANIFANEELQTSGESVQDFSNGPVQYSASAEDGKHLKNYWVTVVQQAAGAKLFVNGANVKNDDGQVVREVFLNDINDNHHDIFLANVGDTVLTGLNATLSEAQNVKLDDYWTVGGDGNNTLAAFTETGHAGTHYGEIANVAKIRLVPDGNGSISGTLTITADGQEPVVIKLTGVAGNPKIVTDTLPEAVKYVPYGSLIQHNNMYDWNTVSFEIVNGALPDGMTIKDNGELYGVPTQTGTFEFTVRMDNSDERFSSSEATFTLNVLENTNENVDASTDNGYDVSIRVPDLMTNYQDEVFESQGELSEFIDFWLDGEKLVRGTDYVAEAGSTKITVRSQTFQKAGPGKHTIAAEFRVDGDENKELKRAAQNYELKLKGSTSSSGFSSGSGSSSGGSKQPVKPTTPVVVPQENQTTVFVDVPADAWYAQEVKWVYEKGLMVGVGDNQFSPDAEISHATVVTVLAREGNVDLIPYAALQYTDIENNQWYSASAKWAKAEELLARQFSPNPPTPRGELAVILVKYLETMNVTMPVIVEPAIFADAAQMTEEEQQAFQILYQLGIFRGKDKDLTMDAQGSTTRAELATLLHRIDTMLKAK